MSKLSLMKNGPRMFFLSTGYARSGTTSLHRHFMRQKSVRTPVSTKEIKYFEKKNPNLKSYIELFENSDSNFFFESSPPYSHKGAARFRESLRRAHLVLGEDVVLLISIRPLLERAFSHYWHDINSQYSLYGTSWKIRNPSSPDRYNCLYNRSFYDEILEQNSRSIRKYFPPISKQIEFCLSEFGEDSVKIIGLKFLSKAIDELHDYYDIQRNNIDEPLTRSNGTRMPYYIHSPEGVCREVETDEGYVLVNVPGNKALLIHSNPELIGQEQCDLNALVNSQVNWTSELNLELLPDWVSSYVDLQKNFLKQLPECVFMGSSKSETLNYMDSGSRYSVKKHIPSFDALKQLNLIQ